MPSNKLELTSGPIDYSSILLEHMESEIVVEVRVHWGVSNRVLSVP